MASTESSPDMLKPYSSRNLPQTRIATGQTTTASSVGPHNGITDTKEALDLDTTPAITFTLTTPGHTNATIILADINDRAARNQMQDTNEPIADTYISDPQDSQQPRQIRPLIFKGEDDEDIIFNDIDENPWKHFLNASPDAYDNQETSGSSNSDDDDDACWVEFEHEGHSPWESDGEDEAEPETEVDLPLQHFQDLPIGHYAIANIAPATYHLHPAPKIAYNVQTGGLTVTHDNEEDMACMGFQVARMVASWARVPLPMSRRIHELQGVICEDRRGSGEGRAYRHGWFGGRRSGLRDVENVKD